MLTPDEGRRVAAESPQLSYLYLSRSGMSYLEDNLPGMPHDLGGEVYKLSPYSKSVYRYGNSYITDILLECLKQEI